MGRDRVGLQEPTAFEATLLGGPARLKGSFILADITQVSNPALWKTTFKNVGLVVSCLRHDLHTEYPTLCTAKSQLVGVDMRNKDLRNRQFMEALPLVEQTLEAGKDVLVHCRESYHRAPICCAAFVYMLCGVDYKVERPTYTTFMAFDEQPIFLNIEKYVSAEKN